MTTRDLLEDIGFALSTVAIMLLTVIGAFFLTHLAWLGVPLLLIEYAVALRVSYWLSNIQSDRRWKHWWYHS
jgi:hypothetical protein